MSQANVDALLMAAAALNGGDVELALSIAAEDIVIITPLSALEGEYRGRDGIRKVFEDHGDSFELFRVELADVRDLDDRVLGIGTVTVRGHGGPEVQVVTAGVADFADGRMTRWHDFGDRRKALAAAGLPD